MVRVDPEVVAKLIVSNNLTPPWALNPPAVISIPPPKVEVAVDLEMIPSPETVSPLMVSNPIRVRPPEKDEVPVNPVMRSPPLSRRSPPVVAAPLNVEVAVVEVA